MSTQHSRTARRRMDVYPGREGTEVKNRPSKKRRDPSTTNSSGPLEDRRGGNVISKGIPGPLKLQKRKRMLGARRGEGGETEKLRGKLKPCSQVELRRRGGNLVKSSKLTKTWEKNQRSGWRGKTHKKLKCLNRGGVAEEAVPLDLRRNVRRLNLKEGIRKNPLGSS